MKTISKAFLAAAALGTAMAAFAGDLAPASHKNVQFAKGANQAVYKGAVKGYDYDSYTFYANKCQVASVEVLNAPHIEAYLLTDKGDNLESLEKCLPYKGKYEIRVMQTRNKAREGQKRNYSMRLTIL